MSVKLLLFYFIAFIILYLEPIEVIGGLTFGIIWKLILMVFLLFPIIHAILRDKYIESFAFFAILLAFKILISYTSMDYLITTLTLFTKAMMFPLLYLYFNEKIKNNETLIFMVKHFSILIILSLLPYMFGLLEPFEKGYDLAEFGHVGEYGLIGPFIKPHSASITIAFAMIIVTTHMTKRNSLLLNLFYIGLLLLGFYELIETYVRTGIAIYIIVLAYIYLKDISFKKILLIILTMFMFLAATVYLYQTNEIVQMRIDDKNKYSKGNEGSGGSGRLIFWANAIENWLDDDPAVIYIGLGYDYAREKMYEDVGLLIFAHNHFIQMLQQEGLIGFTLFMIHIFLIYRFIFRNKQSKYHTATNAIFIGILVEMMFQGGFFFNLVLYLSVYLVVLKRDALDRLNKIKET